MSFNNNFKNQYSNANFGGNGSGIPSYNEGILISPNKLVTEDENVNIINFIVDSRDRDHSVYPDSNSYVVYFPESYRDVLSVELLSIDVPKTQYNVHSNNNILHLIAGADDNATVSVTIPVGEYNITDLLNTIKTSLNANGGAGGATYDVTVDASTRRVTIKQTANATAAFKLITGEIKPSYGNSTTHVGYKTSTIAKILGYRAQLKKDNNNSEIVSEGSYNILGESLVIMKLDALEKNEGTSNVFRDSFARLSLADKSYGDYKSLKVSDFGSKCISRFNPSLGNLSKLNVKFYNQDGSLYDFNGSEHSFTLEIRAKYNKTTM